MPASEISHVCKKVACACARSCCIADLNGAALAPRPYSVRLLATLSLALASGVVPLVGCPGPEPYLPPDLGDFCQACKPGGSLATGLTNPHRYACVLRITEPAPEHDEWQGICMEDGASNSAREAKCDALCNSTSVCLYADRKGSAYWCEGSGFGGSGSESEDGGGGESPSGGGSEVESGSDGSNNAPPWTPSGYVTYITSANVYEVDADFIDYLRTDPWYLLNDPTYSEETPNGIVLRDVQTGTLADALGFEENDVIKSINGHEPKTFVELTDVYLALEHQSSFTVEVTRGTHTVVLQFELV